MSKFYSRTYVILINGPYAGMRRRSDRLPTFKFTAKGQTGFYSEGGAWCNTSKIVKLDVK